MKRPAVGYDKYGGERDEERHKPQPRLSNWESRIIFSVCLVNWKAVLLGGSDVRFVK